MTNNIPRPLLSTRLFPKTKGANNYNTTGIASCCDWVLHSDYNEPFTHLVRQNGTNDPKHVFLSLRSPIKAIITFSTEILPRLTTPFVLISGSEDCTLPTQTDKRWPPFSPALQQMIESIRTHPLLLHWFAENLESDALSKMSPLPVGMVYRFNDKIEHLENFAKPLPIIDRELKVLCGHRVRNGAQWELRRQVTALSNTVWSEFCTVNKKELSEQDYIAQIKAHSFVLCVEGGGIDPSPKAWQALLHGAIPIIRKTGTYRAYADLPVVFVDDWQAESLSIKRLTKWRNDLAPYYDDLDLRSQTLHRLGLEYWWGKVLAAATKN